MYVTGLESLCTKSKSNFLLYTVSRKSGYDSKPVMLDLLLLNADTYYGISINIESLSLLCHYLLILILFLYTVLADQAENREVKLNNNKTGKISILWLL